MASTGLPVVDAATQRLASASPRRPRVGLVLLSLLAAGFALPRIADHRVQDSDRDALGQGLSALAHDLERRFAMQGSLPQPAFEQAVAAASLPPGAMVALLRADRTEVYRQSLREAATPPVVTEVALGGAPLIVTGSLHLQGQRVGGVAEGMGAVAAIGLAGLAIVAWMLRWSPRAAPVTRAARREGPVAAALLDREPDACAARCAEALAAMSLVVWHVDADGRIWAVHGGDLAAFGLHAHVLREGMGLDELRRLPVLTPAGRLFLERLAGMMRLPESSSWTCEGTGEPTLAATVHPDRERGWVVMVEDASARQAAMARAEGGIGDDALTGLPNRQAFDARWFGMAGAARRRGCRIAVLLIDLDQLRLINERRGRAAGDLVLRIAAGRISSVLRDGELLARRGGDEFLLAVELPETITVAAEACQRVIESLASPVRLAEKVLRINASIGVAVWPTDSEDLPTLLEQAGLAAMEAKMRARHRYEIFRPALQREAQRRSCLEDDLHRGLARHEFALVYQPVVDLASGRTCGFEALLRWQHPEHGTLLPADFLPLAETTGLIVHLGERALRLACQDAATWPEPFHVSINLSPRQVRAASLVESVEDALAQTGLAAMRLQLEITDGLPLQHDDAGKETLRRLQRLGVRLALDDFGNGVAALGCLRDVHFDKVKLDRSLVQGLTPRAAEDIIVQALALTCRGMGIALAAKGVETEAQRAHLVRERCREGQGFLFGQPVHRTDIGALLARLAVAGPASGPEPASVAATTP